ncbi:acetone carboxylase subunit gamma [Gephyromycinifex aptenodytis]|uniref:acetone carboxylase subunit gamma n=1 Tax=Gephyromycinifex aptenodytis TaxID=2716227 RepID=UPI001445B955|nr:acetone carboxylase subunit gamma [Gephyromycinifex aptenodytis]
MRVPMTEYLVIDLETERWTCRVCSQDMGDAHDTYKKGALVYNRDPREIHQPIIDPERYEYTFSPDPTYCRILEYYCPGCATQIECEYLPPGHPPTIDMLIDVDALRAQWADSGADAEAVHVYGPGEDAQKYTAALKSIGHIR